jgi:cell envelope opacity-associated protein A
MTTDVQASVPLTGTGQFTNQTPTALGRTRIKAVYIVPTGTAGSVIFRNGGSGGTTVMTLNTVASATQPTYLMFSGDGVLFSTNVHGTVTNVGSVTIFYD